MLIVECCMLHVASHVLILVGACTTCARSTQPCCQALKVSGAPAPETSLNERNYLNGSYRLTCRLWVVMNAYVSSLKSQWRRCWCWCWCKCKWPTQHATRNTLAHPWAMDVDGHREEGARGIHRSARGRTCAAWLGERAADQKSNTRTKSKS